MSQQGWALYSDETIVYMGESTRTRFESGIVKLRWESKMDYAGTVIGIGIKDGTWKTVAPLSPMEVVGRGEWLELNIEIRLNVYVRPEANFGRELPANFLNMKLLA